MNPEPTTPARHDSSSTHDYDELYTWARPASTYLTFREIVRLTILRSKLTDRATHVWRLDVPHRLPPCDGYQAS
jgi:hypothetical protein